MIKFLQSKKGFTIIELIVVLAILAVMMAIVLPLITTERARIREANDTARDFYSAVQSVFSKYSLYEDHLSNEYRKQAKAGVEVGLMRYYMGMRGNFPYDAATVATDYPENTSLYIEVGVKNGQITFVNCVARAESLGNDGMYLLCEQKDAVKDTELGELLKAELEGRISYQTGFYYAKITGTKPNITVTGDVEVVPVRVDFTAFMKTELPAATGGAAAYETGNLTFGVDNKLSNGEICGTCAPWNATAGNYVGMMGTRLS